MPPLTDDLVRGLAAFDAGEGLVVSCYLDVDGSRHVRPQDYELHLEHLLRRGREQAGTDRAVLADLARVEAHVRSGIDRSRTRGLAMFSCRAAGLWEVFELPVPVRNKLVLGRSPYVRGLEWVRDEYERFAVLLADKQRARLFLFELGELVERTERFDALPRHDDDGGDWDRDHVRDHTAATVHRHVRRAAQAAFDLYQEQDFDHLVIGAPDDISRELEHEMHSYLRERIAARLNVPVNARESQVREAALRVEEQVERAKEQAAVGRLRDAVGAANGGVAGLAPVLGALIERRVETLLVSEGYEAPGWRCRACGWLGAKGRKCPVCSAGMDKVDDVVEEAVEEALTQSCTVEMCRDNPDLDVLGRIGALLRY